MDLLLSDQKGNLIHSIPFPIWLAYSHSEIAISVSVTIVKQVKIPKGGEKKKTLTSSLIGTGPTVLTESDQTQAICSVYELG